MTLQGLEVINIDGTDFLFALTAPGMPCTPEELEKRIREFFRRISGRQRPPKNSDSNQLVAEIFLCLSQK